MVDRLSWEACALRCRLSTAPCAVDAHQLKTWQYPWNAPVWTDTGLSAKRLASIAFWGVLTTTDKTSAYMDDQRNRAEHDVMARFEREFGKTFLSILPPILVCGSVVWIIPFSILWDRLENGLAALLWTLSGVISFAVMITLFDVLARCPHGVRTRISEPCRDCEAEQRELARRQREREEQREEERRRQEMKEKQLRRQAARRVRQLGHLKKMPPIQFERLVQELYERLGWEVRGTPASGDGGIDLAIRKQGAYGIIQCKRYRKTLGVTPLRELNGVVHAEQAEFGTLITTASFTRQARESHQKMPKIRLVDGNDLIALIHQTFSAVDELPFEYGFTEDDAKHDHHDKLECPRCGNPTRRVTGKHGQFVGCSGYPQCRWTSDSTASKGRRRRRTRKAVGSGMPAT